MAQLIATGNSRIFTVKNVNNIFIHKGRQDGETIYWYQLPNMTRRSLEAYSDVDDAITAAQRVDKVHAPRCGYNRGFRCDSLC